MIREGTGLTKKSLLLSGISVLFWLWAGSGKGPVLNRGRYPVQFKTTTILSSIYITGRPGISLPGKLIFFLCR
jgi:hypothetical protein